jgi:hypothetical protein
MQDAVNLITHSKTRANPESNVALMTLSDLAVLVTLTTDTGKILAKLHQVKTEGFRIRIYLMRIRIQYFFLLRIRIQVSLI